MSGAPELTPNARRVLEARYLRRDPAGRIVETPQALFGRVARSVAEGERQVGGDAARAEHAFLTLLAALDFLPNSPTLMNAGTTVGQLAACFVLPVEDSIEGIFGSLRAMALVQRSGGGTGFSFSSLRPRGEVVESTGGEASGPISFMRVFDSATENIKLGGRRRGANMGVLRVDHPDIVEFIDAKLDGRSLQNFNLSVAVTDRFMQAALAGEPYDLVHPRTRRGVARAEARAILERIAAAAWRCGDPGLLFLDALNRANPLPALGALETTNPCGEVPLLPYESCVLGSVNLAHMVLEERPDVDWNRLRHAVHTGVRFLDDVIEVSRAPLPETATATRRSRKIGLGVMGFAELLIRLGVSYAAKTAVDWADRLAEFVAREARVASRQLAEERGVFPAWETSLFAARGERLRNATRLSVAPTGTIGIIADTSGGIEPLFALAYRRAHTLGGEPLDEVNPIFLRHVEPHLRALPHLVREVLARGSLREVRGVPDALRQLFVTAAEVPARQHLRIQAAFQRQVDNAVSKTINFPEDASAAEVSDAYVEAWRLGLKGVTVYRYGSRHRQVLTLGAGESAAGREYFAKCDPGACRL
jgi:ribonucleoside-diphosphate reductase alpha chain